MTLTRAQRRRLALVVAGVAILALVFSLLVVARSAAYCRERPTARSRSGTGRSA